MLPVIQELPPMYRLVFNLYVMEEYKHHEVAELLGISVRTSKSNLARAKAKVKQSILKKRGQMTQKKNLVNKSDMDNFFDEIKDNLENRPQPEFEESAWLAMQNKMQEEDHPQRRAAGWWWLSWFVIPLLLSNGWMYVQMEKTEVLLHKMELQRDTIYKTQIIYQTDTIYQSNISQQEIVNSLPVYLKKQAKNNTFTKIIFLPKLFLKTNLT